MTFEAMIMILKALREDLYTGLRAEALEKAIAILCKKYNQALRRLDDDVW